MRLSYGVSGDGREKIDRLASGYKGEVADVVYWFAQQQRKLLKSKKYPPQSGKSQPFLSERQRKYFFWALNNGIITSPYQRTGNLANSWSAKADGWMASIQNSQGYAAGVVGDDQWAYHRGNWWIASEVVEGNADEAEKEVVSRLEKLVK